MNLDHTGLILEGGGLRGVYTSGVLHYFMNKGLFFPYVIGVSMGACNAANYVSRQPERNRVVNIKYVNDPRYLSYYRLFTKGELFGMDFIFDTIPNLLEPFDYKAFTESGQKCIATVTDCISGEALYFEKHEVGTDYFKILQASSSLPFISRPVNYRGRMLMDGGLSDSIPIRKSIHDGNIKNVIVLTRPFGYRKEPESFSRFTNFKYPKYKGLCKALANRHIVYNETIEFVEDLQKKGNVFVIQPHQPLKAGRVERNKRILYSIYDQGYEDAGKQYEKLCEYLDSDE